MDFRDLEAYVHVARLESFSRAATELRVAQSALSRRVDRLEYQLGTKLFARNGRGVRLTEAGRILLDRAESLIRDVAAVEADVQCLAKEPTGRVRLALPPATSEILSPLLVTTCRERFPGISLQIREAVSGVIHGWILEDEVDVGVFYSPQESAELEVVPLVEEPLSLVGPANGSDGRATFPAEALAELSLILPGSPHSLRLVVDRYCAEHGFHPRVAHEVDGIRTAKAMVKAGLGYTIFSHAEIAAEVRGGSLRATPLAPRLTWCLSVIRKRNGRPSRAAGEVARLIEANVASLLRGGFWVGKLLTPAA